jgi:predicted CoA-binding protein
MKNIVVCGVLDKAGSSNVWMSMALQKMGFNIIPINYRTIVQKYGM